MVTKFSALLQNRIIRLFVIESLLFAVIGVFSLMTGLQFSLGLLGVGAIILVLQFSGGRQRFSSRAIGSYMLEKQYLQDIQNEPVQRTTTLVNEFLLIGVIPLVIGLLLEVIP
jgi:hypothetical protein